MRHFKQSGNKLEEDVEWAVTDNAVAHFAPFVVGQMLTSRPANTPQSKNGGKAVKSLQPELFSGDVEINPLDNQPIQAPPNDNISTSTCEAAEFFIDDGERLIPKEKDFKGKTWADQQRAFILLYVWAFRQIKHRFVPDKDHVRAAADATSIVDKANFSKYYNELIKEQISEISSGLTLNNRGERELRVIIERMRNPEEASGHPYWDRTLTNSTKRYRLSQHDKETIEAWSEEAVDLGKLEIRALHTPLQYALVSMWILTSHLNKGNAFRWNWAFHYLCHKYKTVSASSEAFSRVFSREGNLKYFRSTGEEYFLTLEGQKIVDGWREGKSVDVLADISAD